MKSIAKVVMIFVVWFFIVLSVYCAVNKPELLDEQEQEQVVPESYRYLIEIIAPGGVRSQVQCESYTIEKLPYTNRDSYSLFDKEGRQIAVLHVGKNYRVLINDLSLVPNGSKLFPSEVK